MNSNFETLEKEYLQEVQNNQDSYEANLSLANLYFDHQKYEQALPFFKKAVEIVPDSAEAHLRIGEIYFLQESYVEAKESYLKALEIESDNPEALNNLGVLLFNQGEYSEAEAKLQTSIAARPDLFEAALNLGALYLQLNKVEQALQILEKASALNPDSPELRELIDECRKAEGKIPPSPFNKGGVGRKVEGSRRFENNADTSDFRLPTSDFHLPLTTHHSSVDERKVTLYVPCYNAQQYIGDCLEGILKQTYPIKEILVIDDGCTDGSMEIVSQYPVKIIQHEVNKGLSAARNTAIQNATGDFIASLDSDCVPEPSWLEMLMENFTSEEIAGVGGKLIEAHTTTVADLWRSVHLKQYWGDEKITNPDFLFGADNVYRKDALLKVGLYNEEYRTNYEDCDMFERLRKAGYTMVYEPKAIARHFRRDDVCSVVNTLWNWNKHIFQRDGCFDNFERLTQKINLNVVLAARHLMEDIAKRRSQILYPDFLIPAYHTLLDLKFYHAIQSKKTPARAAHDAAGRSGNQPRLRRDVPLEIIEQTFNALIILAAWIAKQKSPDTELYKLIGEDLLTIQLDNSQKLGTSAIPPLSLEELMEELNAQTSDALDIDKYPSLHETYLNHFFNGFQQLFDKIDDPLVVKMIEVSAKAAHVEVGRKIPITNHQSPIKVLLANPPWRKGNRYGVRAGSRWPFTMEIGNAPIPGYVPFPFFLSYAAALLKKNDIEAIIVDAIAEGLTDEEFIHRVRGYNPNLILIETATASIDVDLSMAERLKADLSSNDVKECEDDVYIALSGTHATVMKESLLKEHEYIDFILHGEYEFTLLELVQSLQSGKISPNPLFAKGGSEDFPFNKGGENLEEVQGLAFRRDGEVIVTPPRPLIEDLDELPWPERLSLPMYNYNDQFAGMPYPNVQVMTSRGCPFQCIFCIWPQILYGGAKYRTRSPKDVVDEIEWLIDYYGFEAFYFDDDTFNIGKKRILEICDEIKKRGINVPWAVMARADTSDRETLQAMADAGLYAIKFGVESGVQELVDNCGKKLDLSKVREAVRHCKELGIKTHLTFTFGLPDETKETIQKTIEFAIELNPDSAQFSLTTPFPGTKYFDMLDKKGLLCSKNWADYDGALSTVIQSENLTREELESALEEANRRWNEHIINQRQKVPSIKQPEGQFQSPVTNHQYDIACTTVIPQKSQKTRIAFVCWVSHVRAFKQAYALKKYFPDKYELVLLVTPFENPVWSLNQKAFDHIITYNNLDELKHRLQALKPDLVHYHSQWSALACGVVTIQSAHCPVIMDIYDSYYEMYNFDDVPEGIQSFKYERYCIENCAGLIYKGAQREIDFYRSYFCLDFPVLHFMDYCLDDFIVNSSSSTSEHERGATYSIVYTGGVNPVDDSKEFFANAQFDGIGKLIAFQGIHFHIYPNPFPSHPERYQAYLKLDAEYSHFHFHESIPYDKIANEISQYHYGWWVHFHPPNTKVSKRHQANAIGAKFFTYLEAGLPVIAGENSWHGVYLINQCNLGIVIRKDDLERIDKILASVDYKTFRENVVRHRETTFNMRENIPRLVEFYEKIL